MKFEIRNEEKDTKKKVKHSPPKNAGGSAIGIRNGSRSARVKESKSKCCHSWMSRDLGKNKNQVSG